MALLLTHGMASQVTSKQYQWSPLFQIEMCSSFSHTDIMAPQANNYVALEEQRVSDSLHAFTIINSIRQQHKLLICYQKIKLSCKETHKTN